MFQEEITEQKNIEQEKFEIDTPKPLFTKSRILFLIVVFIVMTIPLVYRYFSYLLK